MAFGFTRKPAFLPQFTEDLRLYHMARFGLTKLLFTEYAFKVGFFADFHLTCYFSLKTKSQKAQSHSITVLKVEREGKRLKEKTLAAAADVLLQNVKNMVVLILNIYTGKYLLRYFLKGRDPATEL